MPILAIQAVGVVYLVRMHLFYVHHTHPSNMTVVSNDPSWWPQINSFRAGSFYIVASFAVVMYDWALTFGQEFELIWRRRWSLMTILYLVVRYVGIPYAVLNMLPNLPSVSVTDAGCNIMLLAINWTNVTINAMIGVIVITRLYAMYQRSRRMLIWLVVSFLAVNIGCGVITASFLKYISGEELVLSGTYQCSYDIEGNIEPLSSMTWMLSTLWEVLALCLAVWIAVKHFRRVQRPPAGWSISDYFTVLINTHVLYFASFAAVYCLHLGVLSPVIMDSNSVGTQTYDGILQVLRTLQMFVLGPRLILSVRQYHAKLIADSDAGTSMTSIVFQAGVLVSTGSTSTV